MLSRVRILRMLPSLLLAAVSMFGQEEPRSAPALPVLTQKEALKRVKTKGRAAYPATAKAMRQQGTVRIALLVGTDGRVQDFQVKDGPKVFVQSAIDWVKQLLFEPLTTNGQPTPFLTEVDVNYFFM